MVTWIWLCIAIDALTGLALLVALQRQDAAGSAMALLPTLLLLAAACLGYWLLKTGRSGAALAVAGIPAVIAVTVLVFTLAQSLPHKRNPD